MSDLIFKNKRIAIVYDWFDKWGGVERVLLTLKEIFPQSDFFSSYYDPLNASWAKKFKIKTSFIQKLPRFIKNNRIVSTPLYPYAFETFNFNNYHLVISVTSSFAKSVITQPETKHICYLLTPSRFLWLFPQDYINTPIKKLISSFLFKDLRKWDYIVAQRPDNIISISKTVAQRCRKYYQRTSKVIYPPFNFTYWERIKPKKPDSLISTKKKFFLVVSRLEPYKKNDLVVKTFNHLPNENLIIVGKGSQEKKLKKISQNNILFLKSLTDQELAYLYSQAKALIIPQEEDFGYVCLEAQFFNCPVIAYKKGGTKETIIKNKTGIFFEKQTQTSLKKSLDYFKLISYNLRTKIKKFGPNNIRRFDKNNFKKSFLYSISNFMNK